MWNKKNIFLIALIILSVVLIALAVFAIRSGVVEENDTSKSIFGNTTTVRDPPPEPEIADVDVRGDASSFWEDGAPQNGVPLLRKLSNEPVAGVVGVLVSYAEYAPEELARFVERSTGYVKDVRLARVEDPSVVRNDTMLRIGRVYWSPNGTTTLLQRLDTDGIKVYSYLTTFGLDFVAATSTASSAPEQVLPTVQGRHLEFDSIVTAAISPDARSVFYIVRTDTGSVGYIESVVLGIRREVWKSPLSSVTATWDTPDTIVIYTNPASDMTGHVWLMNVTTGSAMLALGDEYALAGRINSNGTHLLYSLKEQESGIPSLRVLTLGTGAVTFLPQSISAPIEKCTWGAAHSELVYCAVPRNMSQLNYLENWYLGVLASDDVLWQVNIVTGEAHVVLDPVELTSLTFDIVDLQVSPGGGFLLFRTKTDDALWAATIPQNLLPTTSLQEGMGDNVAL